MSNASATKLAKAITDWAAQLADQAYANLSPKPSRVLKIAPGEQVAWDDCCDGQLWVRLAELQPHAGSTPQRMHGANVCAVPFFVGTFELGIIRCAHTLSAQGEAPSPLQITTDGVQSINDMAQLLAALRCLPDSIRSLTGWTPRGPEGGCHGGYWTFTVMIPNCLECPEPEPEPDPEPEEE